MKTGLVSIIFLSHNSGELVEDSIRSIQSQTYQNWELLVVDDASQDDTIQKVLAFKNKDNRIRVSHTVYENGPAFQLNSALRDAKGRWVAFIKCGDLWEPNKLQKQIEFMEDNGYHFSYTKYRKLDIKRNHEGVVEGGIEKVTYKDLLKCCWLCYPTVMYDASVIGRLKVENLEECNDYALWLKVAKKADCHLLNDCLATQLIHRHTFSPFPIRDRIRWRYMVYHTEMRLNPIVCTFMTIRCLWNGMMKKINYSEKI